MPRATTLAPRPKTEGDARAVYLDAGESNFPQLPQHT